jgi:chromosomal replication initiator protein
LQQQLDPDEFTTWFRPLKVGDENGRRLVLVAPNSRFLHTLEESYRPMVDRAVAGLGDPGFEVLFALDEVGIPSDEPPIAPSSFNPKYTFGSFVDGKSNEFASAAAKRVAEKPAESYNPLFLYGGVGLGKTHLMHAIGNAVSAKFPRKRVLYASSEKFTNDFINSIREQKMEDFRNRYRRIDVLLIDDIQFIAERERTQEEFFHTFNAIHEAGKQIVLSSDRPPKAITTLEERLRSRFEWGLIADLTPPDLETRIAILRSKAEDQLDLIPPDVIEFIARKVVSNVRELEGALNRVIAYASMSGMPISIELASAVLSNVMYNPKKRSITPQRIVRAVADYYGVNLDLLRSSKRDRAIVVPRQIAMYLMREETDISLLRIGAELGGRDHSTVLHAYDKIARELGENDEMRREINAVREMIYSE